MFERELLFLHCLGSWDVNFLPEVFSHDPTPTVTHHSSQRCREEDVVLCRRGLAVMILQCRLSGYWEPIGACSHAASLKHSACPKRTLIRHLLTHLWDKSCNRDPQICIPAEKRREYGMAKAVCWLSLYLACSCSDTDRGRRRFFTSAAAG